MERVKRGAERARGGNGEVRERVRQRDQKVSSRTRRPTRRYLNLHSNGHLTVGSGGRGGGGGGMKGSGMERNSKLNPQTEEWKI